MTGNLVRSWVPSFPRTKVSAARRVPRYRHQCFHVTLVPEKLMCGQLLVPQERFVEVGVLDRANGS